MYVQHSVVTLDKRSAIMNNEAAKYGGGLYIDGETTTMAGPGGIKITGGPYHQYN